ncbi:MAG: hypothetical protein Q7K42_01960 [Candidatus Diapherotrites archaeon]|nr:hypothetical protein [Candidatus Diapherotrites archaeon]
MGSEAKSFRGVDDETSKTIKIFAVEDNVTIGQVIKSAIGEYAEKRKLKTNSAAKKKRSFLDLKPVDFGKGSENWSNEIDEVVYGGRI